ncbi:MAG: glycosyltransferase [Bacteroidales bacterium]
MKKEKPLTYPEKMTQTEKKLQIYLSVTNDVVADQRIHRIATTLVEEGFQVNVVGRRLQTHYDFSNRPYRVHLLNIPFKRGIFFYACYNLWLLLFLIVRKTHVLIANDLDTLIPNFMVGRLKHIPLLFDSHEYFPEVPELVNRPGVKKVWQTIEKSFVPRIRYCYTVCESIAEIYRRQYNTRFEIIRNLPFRKEPIASSFITSAGKNIIYQGALNVGRGLEKVIDAMAFLPDVHFYLAGSGDIENELKQRAQQSPAHERIHFLGRIPPEKLHAYTCGADLGISLEEPLGLNYYYALPNKLFDYIQAEVPVMVSDFPEMKKIVETYQVGLTTNEKNPRTIAAIIRDALDNGEKRKVWKENLKKAATELCWEKEKFKLTAIVNEAIEQFYQGRTSISKPQHSQLHE